jgi:hypothetical protein
VIRGNWGLVLQAMAFCVVDSKSPFPASAVLLRSSGFA